MHSSIAANNTPVDDALALCKEHQAEHIVGAAGRQFEPVTSKSE
jgi:hypothetical protein